MYGIRTNLSVKVEKTVDNDDASSFIPVTGTLVVTGPGLVVTGGLVVTSEKIVNKNLQYGYNVKQSNFCSVCLNCRNF